MEHLSNQDELYNLWLLFGKARRCTFKAREKELLPYGITPEQVSILYIFHNIGEPVTRSEISRLTCREVHTVSGIVARMEKSGLVRVVKDPSRKNTVRFAVTKKGQETYRQSTKRESIYRIFSVLSKEERQQLKSTLEKVQSRARQELGQYYKPPFLRSR